MSEPMNDTIREIVNHGIRLFKINGYDKVSVNDICLASGISRSAFYSIFPGKKAILDYILYEPRNNMQKSFLEFVDAENDFERIWRLCDRFLTIALDFGPDLTGSLFIMQLNSGAGITEAVHSMDEWFIKLSKNCQKAGITNSEEPVEIIAPMATDLICHVTYEWCNQHGSFSLRQKARTYAEIAYHVKPSFRMSEKEKAAL